MNSRSLLLSKDRTRFTSNKILLSGYFDLIICLLFPEYFLIYIYRWGHWFNLNSCYNISKISHRILLYFFNCDINMCAEIDFGLRIPHPVGIVIGSGVKIGKNVTLMSCVTIGAASGKSNESSSWQYPVIKDEVFIGTGAKIIGGIILENRCVIGANSVVTKNTSSDSTYIGVPAKKLN